MTQTIRGSGRGPAVAPPQVGEAGHARPACTPTDAAGHLGVQLAQHGQAVLPVGLDADRPRVRQPGPVPLGRHELGERHALLEVEQVERAARRARSGRPRPYRTLIRKAVLPAPDRPPTIQCGVRSLKCSVTARVAVAARPWCQPVGGVVRPTDRRVRQQVGRAGPRTAAADCAASSWQTRSNRWAGGSSSRKTGAFSPPTAVRRGRGAGGRPNVRRPAGRRPARTGCAARPGWCAAAAPGWSRRSAAAAASRRRSGAARPPGRAAPARRSGPGRRPRSAPAGEAIDQQQRAVPPAMAGGGRPRRAYPLLGLGQDGPQAGAVGDRRRHQARVGQRRRTARTPCPRPPRRPPGPAASRPAPRRAAAAAPPGAGRRPGGRGRRRRPSGDRCRAAARSTGNRASSSGCATPDPHELRLARTTQRRVLGLGVQRRAEPAGRQRGGGGPQPLGQLVLLARDRAGRRRAGRGRPAAASTVAPACRCRAAAWLIR